MCLSGLTPMPHNAAFARHYSRHIFSITVLLCEYPLTVSHGNTVAFSAMQLTIRPSAATRMRFDCH